MYNFLSSRQINFASSIITKTLVMLKTILKRTAMGFLLFLGGYLIAGNLIHRVIAPEKKPDISNYFKPGQQFYSKTEGFRQIITKQEKGFVHGYLEVEPHAPGPPVHIHAGFDEEFQVENGELTIWVNGEIKKLHPGETIHIPKGTPHRPYNETNDTIRVKGGFAFPEKFAFYLSQVYGIMDENPGFIHSNRAPLQIMLLNDAGFDSYIGDGTPLIMQKTMSFLVAPMARLLGYRSYYDKYDPV
jgi:quercetin dioxygenase-like cupin family protein